MKTVLIVDDDPDIRELVAWKLSQAGYAVLAEGDGEAGLATATGRHGVSEGTPPDLVLLDWMMPKMNGIEVCRAMRNDPSAAHVPVILLTAKAQEADVDRGFAAGADDYVVKPFSPRELLSRVQAILSAPEPRRPRVQAPL